MLRITLEVYLLVLLPERGPAVTFITGARWVIDGYLGRLREVARVAGCRRTPPAASRRPWPGVASRLENLPSSLSPGLRPVSERTDVVIRRSCVLPRIVLGGFVVTYPCLSRQIQDCSKSESEIDARYQSGRMLLDN